MRRWAAFALAASVAAAPTACSRPAGTLAAATEALGADRINSIEYTGSGKWYLFGQSPNPAALDPEYDVRSYTATVDYTTSSSHVRMARTQTVEPGRNRPTPREQNAEEYTSGTASWIIGPPGGPATGLPPGPQPEQKNVEERVMEIWATPHGFLKAAAKYNATSTPVNGGSEVTFMEGRHKFVGTINAQNQVERIQTWIDSPILGDMLCEARFSDYRDFGGVIFPGHLVRMQGGKPRLDIRVSAVTVNPPVTIQVPETVRAAMTAPVATTAEKLADGVYWIRGFQWHSVAIEQADHIVVVDGPLHEPRSLAVIAQVKATIPDKPIKYVINTHSHFDHVGGLRTYAAEGAAIVTMPMNQTFYEQAWRAPRTINPDRLAQSGRAATFEPVINGTHVLSDGKRTIEIHQQAGTAHHEAIVFVYLPVEKILIQADAWNTEALTAPRPRLVNPYVVNLYENIQRLKLDVRQIVPLHGPRTVTMAELIEETRLPARAAN